jgi:FRG domain
VEKIPIADWAAFEVKLEKLRADSRVDIRPLLFRGQSDSGYPLATSLEREGRSEMAFSDYYRLIMKVKPAVETFTTQNWEMPDLSEVETAFKNDGALPAGVHRYLIYLRHHGFPSPLLDWSYSPYVAAFFAFRGRGKDHVKERSIYAFREAPRNTKGYWEQEPRIRVIGKDVRSHRRHFLQQSAYTICFDHKLRFYPHEQVSDRGRSHQDVLYRYDLPSTERVNVLQLLDGYNLNAFSLFHSEESLMETMWAREVLQHGKET